jgi:D-serine deaminase-like pyridoxal phosphate-dependent protein
MLAPAGNSLLTLETPRLLLDLDRLEKNCAAMRARCDALGVALRPHIKTAKSVDVAQIATGASGGITVSTLKEAEHFANAGYRDILYAATIVPGKLAHAARIMEAGADLILVTDSPDVVAAASSFAAERSITLSFLIEIDLRRASQRPSGRLSRDRGARARHREYVGSAAAGRDDPRGPLICPGRSRAGRSHCCGGT